MSSNLSIIQDEDGDYSDWIELFNMSEQSISLHGWSLSDDIQELQKWIFPDISINPEECLLLFASDKDRYEIGSENWRTIITEGDIWKCKIGDETVPENWYAFDYNDSAWAPAGSGFGYGDNDDRTYIEALSIYIRKNFTIDDIDEVDWAFLDVDYDDGFVAYLNGTEIARANIGESGENVEWDQFANSSHEAEMHNGGMPERFESELIMEELRSGENTLAIEVHNAELESSDLSLIPFFTLNFLNDSQIGITPPSVLDISQSMLHTNFRIKAGGETIILSQADGTIIDSLYTGSIPTDISKGRSPDGQDNWMLFAVATPGSLNDSQAFTTRAEPPDFLYPPGFYADDFELEIVSDEPDMSFRYSMDGSIPDESSYIYDGYIHIDETTVIRIQAFRDDLLPSLTVTGTYFIDENKSLSVISLTTNPENIYGGNGIFSDNFEREVPVHIEFFEEDKELGFVIDAGAEVFGQVSTGFPQKSLAIFARGKYGYPELDYQLFPGLPIDSFESFLLRNSGNDWWSSMFRDALVTNFLMKGTCVDYQAYRPAVAFINGEYWGLYNIREKISEHYIEAHHDVDSDSIDFLENKELPEPLIHHGDAQHYNAIRKFLRENDMSDNENYEYAKTQIDIDNFLDYQIGEIFCANIDWPANNNKFWRPKKPDGKWRRIIYDTDTGFGLWDDNAWRLNHIEHATNPGSPNHEENWPNPGWSTLFFRKLLENDSFRNDFINRFAGYFETRFSPDFVLEKINEITDMIGSEMQARSERWDVENWNSSVNYIKKIAKYRASHVREHIMGHFGIDDTVNVSIDISPIKGGRIDINSVIMENYPFQGTFFQNIPITFTAMPSAGYNFIKWDFDVVTSNREITIDPSNNISLKAIFEEVPEKMVVINEINYNSDKDFNTGDWIELYNSGQSDMDISGWVFKDDNDTNQFMIPQSAILKSDEYLIICESESSFTEYYSIQTDLLGDLDFKLDAAGEILRFYNESNSLLDSVKYNDSFPWPLQPDGDGYTLELKNPNFDNSMVENWSASMKYGSPGEKNSNFIEIKRKGEETTYTPSTFSIKQNYPNPFNTSTKIEYKVAAPQRVKIRIYDILGRRVRTLVNKIQEPGSYFPIWNGRDDDGNSLANGIYFCQISSGKWKRTLKMALLK